MVRRSLLVLSVLVFALVACGNKDGGGSAETAKFPGTDEGAKQLLAELRNNDLKGEGGAAWAKMLKPSSADYKAVFVESAAAKAEEGYEKAFDQIKSSSGGKFDKERSELLLHKATTEELQKWTPEVEANFPGGYKRVADKYKPGLVVYRWKWVKPGERSGSSNDGLIYVNGHWAWFPKPFRIFGRDGEGGGD